MPPSTERHCAQILSGTDILAGLVDGAGLSARVPACPDWTLRQLATHVGRAQRWAAQITATRSAVALPFREVPGGRFPDDPREHVPWLRGGAELLVTSLREAGSDLVWTFAGMRPAGFWARRMTHETEVHRADAQLAAGLQPQFAPDIAADGIDEWLTLMSVPGPGQPDPRLAALPEGTVLHVHATDEGLGGDGEWLVRREGTQVLVTRGHAKADVALRGPAGLLLLVLVRRLPASDRGVQVLGDPAVLGRWLAATPF